MKKIRKRRPRLDSVLCWRAQRLATGAHIHTTANLLTTYLGEHQAEDFVLDRFMAAETRLRAFVAQLAVDSSRYSVGFRPPVPPAQNRAPNARATPAPEPNEIPA